MLRTRRSTERPPTAVAPCFVGSSTSPSIRKVTRTSSLVWLCIYSAYIARCAFEWDPAKAAENFQTHGIAFEDAAHIFDGPVIEAADMREGYGEDRYLALGVVQGVELAVVYTERKDAIRLISARRATTHEREAYWKDIRG